jgi:hypothetical protein
MALEQRGGTPMTTKTHSTKATLGRLMGDTRGEFVEYIITIGVVCLLSIAAFTMFGKDVQNKIEKEGNAVLNIQQ